MITINKGSLKTIFDVVLHAPKTAKRLLIRNHQRFKINRKKAASLTAGFMAAVFALTQIITPATAAQVWIQNDWSGETGPSTTNQYSAATNIDSTTTPGQISLSRTSGWSNDYSDWGYRNKITFDNTDATLGVASEELVDFPVLVKLDSGANIDYSKTQDSGQDLRFSDSDGTPLSYEIEEWDETGSSYAWVKVPRIDQNSDSDHIYMYYGNSLASDGQSVSDVWNDDYLGVWHLNDGVGNGGTIVDSTANSKNGIATFSGQGTCSNVAGKFAGACNFDGTTDYIDINNISVGSTVTITAWARSDAPSNRQDMLWLLNNSTRGGPDLWFSSNNIYLNTWDGTRNPFGPQVDTTEWHSYTTVISPSATELYIDGVLSGTANYRDPTQNSFAISSSNGYDWDGQIDEVSVYSGTFGAGRIAASYRSESNTFNSFSAQEQQYATTGTLTSNIYDLGFGGDWNTMTFTNTGSGAVSVKVRTSNDATMSGAADWSSCPDIVSGTDLTGVACMNNNDRYIQYQVALTAGSDNSSTPIFSDIAINYQAWDNIAPTVNASAISMSKEQGGDNIAAGDWTNGSNPSFTWTAGSDDALGSGIKGYCLYLGTDQSANMGQTKGLLGTSPLDTNGECEYAISGTTFDAAANTLGTALTSSNDTYYLLVKAIDTANNIYQGSPASFSFRFDNTAPRNPDFISAPSQFVADKNVTLTWPTTGDSGSGIYDGNSGLLGLQYKIGSTGTWYGSAHNGQQDVTDVLNNNGSYQMDATYDFPLLEDGNNIIYFRTIDNAGNTSAAHVSTVIKLNTTSPSSPQNLSATPETNTENSFAFDWLPPTTFAGSLDSITYCYTVNTLPNASNCTYTAPGQTSLPAAAYATQPNENTMYVVAKDEAGNINYATSINTTFSADTSAPGIPLNIDVADISVKATSNWKLALSWESPTNVGAGVANYQVFRSTNQQTGFSRIATTSGNSYVDSGLDAVKYYYYVKACDSANNCGVESSTVNKLPTGRFTSAAKLIDSPSVSVSTRQATISWVTDRDSDSRIQYGAKSGSYHSTESAISDQVKIHKVDLTGLDAGKTYFYKAKWTDRDGNTGSSAELSFTTLPAPTIKKIEVIKKSLNSATIQFTSTDATKVNIYYGKTEGFGGLKTINTSTAESVYTVELPGLDDGSTYYFRLDAVDTDGFSYAGNVFPFSTPPAPRISNLRFQPIDGEPTSTQKVTWTTNVPSTSTITYGLQGSNGSEIQKSKPTREHAVTIKNLADDSLYFLVAQSRDAGGNLATSDRQTFKTALDTRPPKISGITTETSVRGNGAEARGQIVVSWQTDEPATSQVAYGEGSDLTTFNSKTAEDATLSTEHIVIISDLATSKVYTVQPISNDKASNTTTGETGSAIISRATDSVMTIVLNSLKQIFGF